MIDLGRIQRGSMRTRLQDKMMMLRKTFRAALKEDELQDAFDERARAKSCPHWTYWFSQLQWIIEGR